MVQKSAAQREQQFVDVIESLSDGFFILDEESKFSAVNKMFEKMTGMKRVDLIGKNLWEIFPEEPAHASLYFSNYQKVIDTQKPVNFEVYNEPRDTWTSVKAYPISSGGISVFVSDITQKHRSEEKLHLAREQSEHRRRVYETVASHTPDHICVLDLEFKVIFANEALLKTWGKKVMSDAVGKTLSELGYDKDIVAMHESELGQVVATKKRFRGEVTLIYFDQGQRTHDYIYTPVFDENGEVIEIASTTRDITELKHAEKDRLRQHETEQRMKLVTDQRNALVKINKAKDEFISLASHQLRTPATVVKQYTSLLLKDFTGESLTEQQREFIRIAHDSNEQELRIIDELLKTAQIDASNYSLNTEEYNVVELIKDVVDTFMPVFKSRKQNIFVKSPPEIIKLTIDVTEMKLAITNLVENASKYSHNETDITVTVKLVGDFVEISVADNGVGIDSNDHESIFDKFTRIDNELSDTVSGTGLGLYWVRQIARSHNGSVAIDSAPGQGSTFTMRLPV